ncbi:hypothetical protein P8C59_001002 [Phyllachora maydis]|uniref:Multidrug and toxin extrusion protein n=1 Tax=Phyllachora maydis TaxID=1825666 RepID=A0AAD9MBT9_9PEZI|nr:hypothetical protein P8C59_001002 [Phyllachora maydis]
MASAQPIRGRQRNDSLLESFAGSFHISGSPTAHDIIARDLADCVDAGSEGDDDDDDDGDDGGGGPDGLAALKRIVTNEHAPILLGSGRPMGVAFGTLRPAIALEGDCLPDLPDFLTLREMEESRNAERSLMRDNHLLPPKHKRSGHESWPRRLYRDMFSTKVRDVDETSALLPRDLFRPKHHGTADVDELSDPGYDSIPPTPGAFQRQWESAVEANVLKTTWQREAKTLAQYASPLIVTFLLHYSVTVTSVFTVGRIGVLELGAVSLATMTANISCYAPMQGLATCLDTLCAQAFGSGHRHLVGLQLQRMTYLLWMLILPIAVLWYNAGEILARLIPDADTAALAGRYLRILILGTPGVAAFESGKRFVQAQGLFHATTWVLLIGAPLNMLANWFLVWRMGWGFTGAASAVVLTQNLLPLLLVLYVVLVEGSGCWNGLSRRAFSNWGPMIKLALPGMIMVEAQYFAFEILTFAAGQFGTTQLAAQSILVTMTSTCFNIPFPLSIAASTRVANLIGARLSGAAKTSARVALLAGVLTGLLNLTLLGTLRGRLPYLFTDDEAVAGIVAGVAPICALMQIFDSLAAMSHGLLRGIGRQAIGGYTNLFSYYCIAIPISFSLAFAARWQLAGLWTGVTTGLVVVTTVELFYLYQADWEHAVEEAEARMRSDHEAHEASETRAQAQAQGGRPAENRI